jgi:DNA-binding transcriptional LysR family regulator
VRLVQRTTRKLALTDIGEAYYERCARIVADVQSAEQLVTDMQSTPRGRVRVTAPIDLSTKYLGAIISEFLASHADVFVELEATDRIVDLIEEGFDLGIRFGQLPESTLIARKLCSTGSLLVASPEYLARRGTPTNIEQLDEHDRLLFTPTPRVQSWALVDGDDNTAYEFGRPARFASNNVGAVYSAVVAGNGISVLSEFQVACDIHSGRLVHLLPEWRGRAFDVHAVYPARQNLPPRLSLFIEFLQKAMDPPPWTKPDHR